VNILVCYMNFFLKSIFYSVWLELTQYTVKKIVEKVRCPDSVTQDQSISVMEKFPTLATIEYIILMTNFRRYRTYPTYCYPLLHSREQKFVSSLHPYFYFKKY
jgi:hypothetical protein